MRKHRILVVDDDAIFLMLTEKFLEQIDFHEYVETFINGQKVSDFLAENYNTDDIYVVLLDLNMPVMNGWEFLDDIKDKGYDKNLDVFIVTSSTDKADIEKSKTFSLVKDYISKPLTNKGLGEIKLRYVVD
ncbi:MAG: response regulator [Candidatus Paceibacterota bacterium]